MTKQDIEIIRTDVLHNEKGKQTHAFGQNVLSRKLQSEVHMWTRSFCTSGTERHKQDMHICHMDS